MMSRCVWRRNFIAPAQIDCLYRHVILSEAKNLRADVILREAKNLCVAREILRFPQNDMPTPILMVKIHNAAATYPHSS